MTTEKQKLQKKKGKQKCKEKSKPKMNWRVMDKEDENFNEVLK